MKPTPPYDESFALDVIALVVGRVALETASLEVVLRIIVGSLNADPALARRDRQQPAIARVCERIEKLARRGRHLDPELADRIERWAADVGALLPERNSVIHDVLAASGGGFVRFNGKTRLGADVFTPTSMHDVEDLRDRIEAALREGETLMLYAPHVATSETT